MFPGIPGKVRISQSRCSASPGVGNNSSQKAQQWLILFHVCDPFGISPCPKGHLTGNFREGSERGLRCAAALRRCWWLCCGSICQRCVGLQAEPWNSKEDFVISSCPANLSHEHKSASFSLQRAPQDRGKEPLLCLLLFGSGQSFPIHRTPSKAFWGAGSCRRYFG